jgi:hypothetical protein
MPSFDEVLERFWAPGSERRPVTNDALSDTERELGVRLAPDYVALLRVQDGGAVSEELNAFPLDPPDPWGAARIWLPELYGAGETGRSDDIHDPDWGPPEGLVLIASPDAGHQFLALDYRASGPDGEPSVLWADTEGPFVQPLAASFRAFLVGLRPAASFPDVAPSPAVTSAKRRRRWPFGRRG